MGWVMLSTVEFMSSVAQLRMVNTLIRHELRSANLKEVMRLLSDLFSDADFNIVEMVTEPLLRKPAGRFDLLAEDGGLFFGRSRQRRRRR